MTEENKLVQELIKEKRSERHFRIVRTAAIVALATGYLYVLGGGIKMANDKAGGTTVDHVAIVDISGEIGPGKDASLRKLGPALKNAFANTSAKAIVLRINSPGGTPVQSSLIHDEILRLKKTRPGVPVVAVGEDMVTSGAYLISMAADKLLVNRSTMTGSVGVIIRSFGFTGLMEKLGVERRALTAGESKNQMDPFGPMTKGDEQKISHMLTNVHGHFKDIVEASRKQKLKAPSSELFTGAVWTGDEAVALGLADGLGSVQTVMDEVKLDKSVVYAVDVPWLESITRSLGVSMAQTLIAETKAEAPAELSLR